MAEFNPAVKPNQDPSFIGLSKSISPVQPNAAFGTLFSSIGNAFETTVKAADFVVKESRQREVRDAVDTERTFFTTYLEGQQELLSDTARERKAGVAVPPMEAASYAPVDERLPPALENLPGQVEKFKSAGMRAKNSIDETAYQGRLAAFAKSMRAAYPGYREFIDKEFAEATGGIPANQYYKAVLGNLNTYLKDADDPMKRFNTMADSFIKEHAFGQLPNGSRVTAATVKEWVNTGKWTRQQGEQFFNELGAVQWQSKQMTATAANIDAVDKVDERQAQQIVSPTLDGQVAQHLSNIQTVTDLNDPNKRAQLNEWIKRASPEELWAKARELHSSNDIAKREMFDMLFKLKGKDGKTMVERLGGGAKAWEYINKKFQPADAIAESLAKKEDVNIVNWETNWIKAAQQRDFRDLYIDPEMKEFRLANVLNKHGGPGFLGDFIKQQLPNVSSKWGKVIEQMRVIQTNSADQIDRDGEPYTTPSRNLDHASKIGAGNDPKVVEAITVGTLKLTLQPKGPNSTQEQKDRADRGIFYSFFHPKNVDMLARIVPDGYNDKGLWVKGRSAAFFELTSPQVSERVRNMNDPKLWGMYKEWAEYEYFNHIFKQDLTELKNYDRLPDGVAILWRPDQKKWELEVAPASQRANTERGGVIPHSVEDRAVISDMRDRLKRLNEGLGGLVHMAKISNTDVEEWLGRRLVDMGVEPGIGDIRKAPIPDKMFNSLLQSRLGDRLRKGQEEMRQNQLRNREPSGR